MFFANRFAKGGSAEHGMDMAVAFARRDDRVEASIDKVSILRSEEEHSIRISEKWAPHEEEKRDGGGA